VPAGHRRPNPCFLAGTEFPLAERLAQGDASIVDTGFARLDDVGDVEVRRRFVRRGELVAVVLRQFGCTLGTVFGVGDFLAVDDFGGAFGAHDGDFGRRPGDERSAPRSLPHMAR
jgi:hypothetical protein